MIGGVDIIFQTNLGTADALDLCARAIVTHWRGALVQDAITAKLYTRYPEVPFGNSPEFMIYRDDAAFKSWEELEADPSNENTMIHLLSYRDGQVTVVVDDAAAAEMRGILETIRGYLRDCSTRMGVHEIVKEAA